MISNFKAPQLSGLTLWLLVFMVLSGFFLGSCGAPKLSRFEVQRPSRINVPRDVQKVFIRSDLVVSENDQLGLKKNVLQTLASELNRMGRFEAKIVETLDESSFNPEKDQIGVIQGEIISGGELDRGRFTDIATCTGGLGGRISSAGAGAIENEAITLDSWRGYVCRKGNLKSDLLQGAFTSVLAGAGLEGAPPKNQVVRVYEYRNVTLFAQLNFSFTLIGSNRQTLAIRSDAASYGTQTVSKDSYRHAQEVHNIVVDFLGPLIVGIRTPIFPVPVPQAAQAMKTNPRNTFFPEGPLPKPTGRDLPEKEKNEITRQLIRQGIQDFIQTISPYKIEVGAEVASGGKADAGSLLIEGKLLKHEGRSKLFPKISGRPQTGTIWAWLSKPLQSVLKITRMHAVFTSKLWTEIEAADFMPKEWHELSDILRMPEL